MDRGILDLTPSEESQLKKLKNQKLRMERAQLREEERQEVDYTEGADPPWDLREDEV